MDLSTKIKATLHIPLATCSKLMCSCKSFSADESNTHTCPVCLGVPGAFALPNEGTLLLSLMTAVSFHCIVDSELIFDRELCSAASSPKGFKYTQIRRPLGVRGYIETDNSVFNISSVSLTEAVSGDIHKFGGFNNFNLCGSPLLKIESAPDLRGSEDVEKFVKSIFFTLNYLGISHADPVETPLQFEFEFLAPDPKSKNASTYIKAFDTIENLIDVIDYEDGRRQGLAMFGKNINSEYFTYNNSKRSLEPAHEPSSPVYIPEYELPPVSIQDDFIQIISTLVELPENRKKRYMSEYQMPAGDADIICREKAYSSLFDECVKINSFPAEISHWIAHELHQILKKYNVPAHALDISAEYFSHLIELRRNSLLTIEDCREALDELFKRGTDPYQYASNHSMFLVVDRNVIKMACRIALQKNLSLFSEFLKGSIDAFDKLAEIAKSELLGRADLRLIREVMLNEASKSTYNFMTEYPAQTNLSAFELKNTLDASQLMEMTENIEDSFSGGEFPSLSSQHRDISMNEISRLVDSIVEHTLAEHEPPDLTQDIDDIISKMLKEKDD